MVVKDLADGIYDQGRLEEAIVIFSKLKLHHPLYSYSYAVALLGADDEDGYRRVISEIQKNQADSNNPQANYWVAWTTVLQPIPDDRSEAALKLAQSLTQPEPPDQHRLALAATLLRCQEYTEAIRRLEQLHTEWEKAADQPVLLGDVFKSETYPNRYRKQQKNPKTYSPAYLWYFLAMAHHKKGNDDEARQYFERANDWVAEESRESRNGKPHVPWERRVTHELLRSEVGELLSEKATDSR